MIELLRTLAVLAEPPTDEHDRLATLVGLSSPPSDAAWTSTFVIQLFPYASVQLGPEGMLGGVARDRIAGMLRTLQATPPTEPDHLPVLLLANADLLERAEGRPAGRAAHGARSLLHEHLLSWLPVWLARVEAIGAPPYDEWAALLTAVLHRQVASAPEPGVPSVHLATAPPVDDPRAGASTATSEDSHGRGRGGAGARLVEQLLVPVRTGLVLARDDLGRAAADLRLAGRIGERRYVLEQLLGQDPSGMLRWLADHAVTSTEEALAPWRDELPVTTAWWSRRSRSTAGLLDELAGDAAGATVTPVG